MKSVIVSAKRTPIGSFQGSLSSLTASQLGGVAIKSALQSAGVEGKDVDEVIMGCVLSGGQGQAPARQAMIKAGLPTTVAAMTMNKVCGSGLKSVMLADQAIRCGDSSVIVAGGMEAMSKAPYFLEKARDGYRMGNGQLIDLMIHDGLWDPYNNIHMGVIGEKCAKENNITREQQDEYAEMSYKRAMNAVETNRFAEEITTVEVPQRRGEPISVSVDEEPGRGKPEKLGALRTAFDKNGTITAGNASSINDGAAAVVVMSEEKAKALKIKPLVKIIAQATASQDPDWFTTAPASAMQKALDKAGLKVEDIDLWEVNEAFAVVSIYNNNKLNIPFEKCNVNGGAVALGHPIGASGTRLLVTLIHEMQKQEQAKYGMVSLCIGGGEAVALIIEKL